MTSGKGVRYSDNTEQGLLQLLPRFLFERLASTGYGPALRNVRSILCAVGLYLCNNCLTCAGSMADGGHQEQTLQPVSGIEKAEAVLERSEQSSTHSSSPPISYGEINAPRLEDAGLEDPRLHLNAVQYSTVMNTHSGAFACCDECTHSGALG